MEFFGVLWLYEFFQHPKNSMNNTKDDVNQKAVYMTDCGRYLVHRYTGEYRRSSVSLHKELK